MSSPSIPNLLLEGVRVLAKAVGVTYGPAGRTVMVDRKKAILSTKDGATVAWEVEPSHRIHRLGSRAVQEACGRVSKECGDGTSTTAILAHAFLEQGIKWVAAGIPPNDLVRNLQAILQEIEEYGLLAEHHREVTEEDLFHVAMVASNHDEEIAKGISEALLRVGNVGMIVVEEGKGRGIELVQKTGLELDRGWESSDLAGDNGAPRTFSIPLIALIDGILTKQDEIVPILEEATQFPHPLILVSQGCYGDALKVLTANDRKLKRSDGLFEGIATRSPGGPLQARNHLDDLAAMTTATVLDPKMGIKFSKDFFGFAQEVTVKKDSAVFLAFPDRADDIEQRVLALENQVQGSESSHDVERLRTRMAMLTDGLCLLRVGGASQAEIRERRGRIEDALNAAQQAVQRGVVPGGGMAFCALATQFEDHIPEDEGRRVAEQIFQNVLCQPLRILVRNAGGNPEVVLSQILASLREGRSPWIGWDVLQGSFRDFREGQPLYDPYSVVMGSLRAALSVATTLLTVEVALLRKRPQHANKNRTTS